MEQTGLEEASKAAVLGHELGHANGDKDSGPNRMDNVGKNQNTTIAGLGEPDRTDYIVPTIKWKPGVR